MKKIPRELEGLYKKKILFKVYVKVEQLDNQRSAFTVMKIVLDPNLIATYFGSFEDLDDIDQISKMVVGDDNENVNRVDLVGFLNFFR